MSLLSAYHFDEGTGTTAEDVAGTRDITVVSGNWEATGHTNSSFDGAGGVRNVPSITGLETASRTVMFWARSTTGTPTESRWLLQFYITASDTAAFGIGWIGGNLFGRARRGGSNANITTAIVDAEGWHHFALTYDGTTLRGYRDAVEFANTAASGTIDTANTVNITDTTNGDLIDDLRFYDEALSQATIESLMDTPVTGAEPQTVTPTGIAASSTVGTPVITTSATVTPTGVASTATVGTPSLTTSVTITPTGIASTAAAGTPEVSTLTTVTPTAVASTSTVGSPTVSTATTVRPTGIASTTTVGTPTTTGPGFEADTPQLTVGSPVPNPFQAGSPRANSFAVGAPRRATS